MKATASKLLSLLDGEYVRSISRNGEPSWLEEMRTKAFSQYINLPSEVSPLYSKYSDVKLLKPESIVLVNDSRASKFPDADLKARLEELEKETGALQIGQSPSRVFVDSKAAKQGIIVSDIRDAFVKHEDIVKKLLAANPLNYGEDKFLALEASAFQSGIFVYIPRNVVLEDPIRIVSSLADDGTSMVNRNIVAAEEGSKATVVQELYAPQIGAHEEGSAELKEGNGRANQKEGGVQEDQDQLQQAYFELVETHVDPNAHLELVTLQAMGGDNTICISNRKAYVENDAKMSWYIGMFGSQLSRYKTDSIMKGQGSSAEDVEIIFGVGNQSFDITSNLVHFGRNSRGRVLVKSVLKDTSKSLFKGMIKIGKEAKATESYLAGHAILLDKGAKSDSIPGLEIETNEVKATHSASVAQIDEGQIFYLMTRGLTRDGAKREIVNGFLEPLSRKMGPTIRAWVNYLIENKWLGKPLMLRSDEAMEQILEVEKSRYRETQDLFEKHYKYR